jgi:hypothetical protein
MSRSKSMDEVVRYLDLMVIFGIGFDRDPQLSWAAPDPDIANPPTLLEVWKNACSYLREVAGMKGETYLRALMRARRAASQGLMLLPWTSRDQATELMRRVHPEKFRLMEDRTGKMWALARAYGERHGNTRKTVYPIYFLLMFLLGSHFECDPRYRWAFEILRDTSTPMNLRMKRLVAASEEAMDRAFAVIRRTAPRTQES